MEGQDYLNQIAAENRPIKKGNGILSSKIFLVSMIGLVALIVVIIVGSILSGAGGGKKELCFALKLHLDNTSEVINEYQSNVKSSNLRSSSASLSGVIANTNRDLTEYITAKYNYNGEKSMDKKLIEEYQLELDSLKTDLFEAKINGILDRIYAHKIAYEISILMSEENKIYNSANDDTLKDLLLTSYSSLEQLYDKFNDFSEANK